MPTESGPTTIRSLAVSVEDLVTALELNETTPRRAVLRVTPPFSGRMRARLHVVTEESDEETLHVDPKTLLEPDAPAYPSATDTEDELRNDPGESYTVERHHDYHLETVAEWRNEIAESIRLRATVQTADGPHEVDVVALGDVPAERSERPGERAP